MPLTDGEIQDLLEKLLILFPWLMSLLIALGLSLFWLFPHLLMYILEYLRKYWVLNNMDIQLARTGFFIGSDGRRYTSYSLWDSLDPECKHLKLLFPSDRNHVHMAGVWNKYTGQHEDRLVLSIGNPYHQHTGRIYIYQHRPYMNLSSLNLNESSWAGRIPVILKVPAPSIPVYLAITTAGFKIKNLNFNIFSSDAIISGIQGQVQGRIYNGDL